MSDEEDSCSDHESDDEEGSEDDNYLPEKESTSKRPRSEGKKDSHARIFRQFKKWCKDNNLDEDTGYTEAAVYDFIKEKSTTCQQSTLRFKVSGIRAKLKKEHNIDLDMPSVDQLLFEIRPKLAPPKDTSTCLTFEHLNNFLTEAPDKEYLATKVAALFMAYDPGIPPFKLVYVTTGHIEDKDGLITVKFPDVLARKNQRNIIYTNKVITFTINAEHSQIVRRYLDIRPKGKMVTDRLFLNFQNENRIYPMGRNTFAKVIQDIAWTQNLPNPKSYATFDFKLPSARNGSGIHFIPASKQRRTRVVQRTHGPGQSSKTKSKTADNKASKGFEFVVCKSEPGDDNESDSTMDNNDIHGDDTTSSSYTTEEGKTVPCETSSKRSHSDAAIPFPRVASTNCETIVNSTQPRSDDRDKSDNESETSSKRAKSSEKFDYFYKTLYVNKLYSDVTIVALDKEWKLHRAMLCQSPYFQRLFESSWKEGGSNTFDIKLPHNDITLDALDSVFATFYQGDINVDSRKALPILATARFFELRELTEECEAVIQSTPNLKDAIYYCKLAKINGASDWLIQLLSSNFLSLETNYLLLREITSDTMKRIVSDLCLATPSEWHIYKVLRAWLYANLCEDSCVSLETFYKTPLWTEPFLSTEDGKQHISLFRTLKIKNLLLGSEVIDAVESDNLFPQEWLNEAFKDLWKIVLKLQTQKDRGPIKVRDDIFEMECLRTYLGVVEADYTIPPRFYLFDLFGLYLEFGIDRKSFTIKRLTPLHQKTSRTLLKEHKVAVKVIVHSIQTKKPVFESEIVILPLRDNLKEPALTFDNKFPAPFAVYVKFLVYTPLELKSVNK